MTGPLRVLHVHSGNMYGGVETVLVTLAKLRGECPEMESSFALCFDGRLSEELTAAGAAVYRLGRVRFSRPWTVWSARRRLRQLLEREQFDIAMFHGCWSYALFAATCRRKEIPLVFWAHDIPNGTHWLERRSSRVSPNLVLANSRFTASAVPKLFAAARIEVQYPIVQLDVLEKNDSDRAAVRKELATRDDQVVIIVACRMERWKGHLQLIEALALLSDEPTWRCWVVGGVQRPAEQEYFAELKQIAEKAGIAARVEFLGQRTDVPRLLRAADIYCQPNTSPEPFGLAFVEAMAAGLPVLTTAMGGAMEIVDDSCGVLVEPSDGAALPDALRILVNDSIVRQRLSASGQLRVSRFCDLSTQLAKLCDGLSQLVDAKCEPRSALVFEGFVGKSR